MNMRSRALAGAFIVIPIVLFALSALSAVAALPTASGPVPGGEREFLTLKRDLVIPDRKTGDDGLLTRINSLHVDDKGTIYVLDSKEAKVSIFKADGSLIRSIGKAGQGPGELQDPMFMSLRKDGTIAVFGEGNRRLVAFSPEGAYIDGDIDLMAVDSNFYPLAEDEAAVYGTRSQIVKSSLIEELVRFDKKTKAVSGISKFDIGMEFTKLDLLAGRFILRTRGSGGLIWVYTKDYEFFLGSPSGLTKGSVIHKFPLLRVTEADKKMWIKKYFGAEDKVPKRYKLVWPEYYPPISDMVLDDKDWIYVRTYESDAAGMTKYDVFDAGCVYRGSFHFGPGDILVIRNGRAYVVTEDAEGFPIIERYVITPSK